MTLGGIDLYELDQMTMILELPLWWTFPAAILCLVLLVVVCVYSFVRSINETRLNRTL
jgi:TRAP-type C4-dicarboxylate transport system permease small subunit